MSSTGVPARSCTGPYNYVGERIFKLIPKASSAHERTGLLLSDPLGVQSLVGSRPQFCGSAGFVRDLQITLEDVIKIP